MIYLTGSSIQNAVCRLLNEVGLTAETEVKRDLLEEIFAFIKTAEGELQSIFGRDIFEKTNL